MDQLNMEKCHQQLDITKEFNSLVSDLKAGDIELAEGFSLLDAMSASELFDQKVDTKLHLKEADTPGRLLEEGKIKAGQDLSNEEVLGLVDLTVGKLMLWLQGHGLSQTIYTLVYQYDEALFAGNEATNSLYQFVNTTGNTIFNVVKMAPFLREEDYIPNVFSFRAHSLPFAQLLALLNELDSKLSKSKKAKTVTLKEGLSARVKVIKGFALLVQALSQPYSQDQHNEILNQVDFIRKRIEAVRASISFAAAMDNYENHTISKHIRYMISARKVPAIQMQHSLDYLDNMLHQLEAVLTLSQSRSLNEIIEQVDKLVHQNPKNVLVRAYLESNLFRIEQTGSILYFGKLPLQQLIRQHLTQLFPFLKDSFDAPRNELNQYMDYLQSVTYEYVTKQLRGNFRQMRDFHKLYQHFSILIHESTQVDQLLGPSNKQALMINAYDLSLRMMLKQLLLGFELQIYHLVDYSMIFHYLECLTNVIDKNNLNFMNTLPVQAQQNLPKGAKKKKYLNEVQEAFYDKITYYKGLHHFAAAFSRLCYILQANKVLPNEDIQYRYSNRFKIFEYCYFIKPITYQEYQNKMEQSYKSSEDLTNALNFVSEQLKEAQQSFQKVDMEIAKLCVVSSLGVMKMKMNAAKISETKVNFKTTQIPYLPVFELV